MNKMMKDLVTKLWPTSSKQKLDKMLQYKVREEEPNMGFKKTKVS